MKSPEPEPGIPEEVAASAQALWDTANSGQPLSVTVEMNNIKSCVEAKARFVKRVFRMDEVITVEVYIRYSDFKIFDGYFWN